MCWSLLYVAQRLMMNFVATLWASLATLYQIKDNKDLLELQWLPKELSYGSLSQIKGNLSNENVMDWESSVGFWPWWLMPTYEAIYKAALHTEISEICSCHKSTCIAKETRRVIHDRRGDYMQHDVSRGRCKDTLNIWSSNLLLMKRFVSHYENWGCAIW